MHAAWLQRVVVVAGLVMAAIGLFWLRGAAVAARTQAAHPQTVSILVPRTTLPAGTTLAPQEFASRTYTLSDAPPGAIGLGSQVSGAVARQTLFAGEPVVAGMLYPDLAAAQIDAQVPPGRRAVDLPVGAASGMGGLLAVGDHVDVTVVLNMPKPHATVLLSDVSIIALVGGSGGTASVAGVSAGGSYTSVILSLTPRQSTALALAQSQGTISLVLRNPNDGGQSAPTLDTTGLVGGIQ